MVRKNPKFPGAKREVCARFDQKREKGGTFRLAHFNISAPNRPSRLRINDSGLEKAHFRGVRGNPFSQSIDRWSPAAPPRLPGETPSTARNAETRPAAGGSSPRPLLETMRCERSV
jgi:hypothetical protein